MMYLVMMRNSWGKGDTIDKAEKIARSEGNHGRKKMPRIVFSYDPAVTPTAYIDDMGSLCWIEVQPLQVENTTHVK